MAVLYWTELTTGDFAAPDAARQVVLLPVAAVEQHGPHLPLGTDAAINTGIVRRAVELAPADLQLLILPPVAVGLSPEHRDFPGTLTVTPATLLRLVVETAEGVARAGLRKIVLFNSHGGQPQLLEIAAQELRTNHAMVATVVNASRLMDTSGLVPAAERDAGIHGGAIETALMLHLHPDLVRRDRIADFPSAARRLEKDYPGLAAGGRLKFAWQSQDLNPGGAVGDARLATAEIGRALVDQAARGLLSVAGDLSRLPLDVVRAR